MYFKIIITALSFILPLSSFAENVPANLDNIAYVAISKENPFSPAVVNIIDANTHQYIGSVKGDLGNDEAEQLIVSPDKKTLYVLNNALFSSDRSVFIVDTATNSATGLIKGLPSDATARTMAISPDGKKGYICLWGSEAGKNKVVVFDTSTNTVIGTVKNLDGKLAPVMVLFSQNKKQAFIISRQMSALDYPNKLSYVDTTTDTVTQSMNMRDGIITPNQFALSNDSKKLYYGPGNTGPVIYINPETQSTNMLSNNVFGHTIIVSSDGKKVFIEGVNKQLNGYISIFDTATDVFQGTLSLPTYSNSNLFAISPDNAIIYVSVRDGKILVYDTASLKYVASIALPQKNWINSIVFLKRENQPEAAVSS